MTQAARKVTVATLVVLSFAAMLLTALPASAATASPSAETLAVRLINEAREARGLRPLAQNLQMVRHGRDWAAEMASQQRVSHRSDLALAIDGDFQRVGENVGYTRLQGASAGDLVRRLHAGFMASSGHRAHILGDYNMVGVGIFRDRDGAMWMAVNFLKGPRDDFPLYRDIQDTAVESSVNRLFRAGVLGGCQGNRYCPGRAVTQAEISRALQNATGSTDAAEYMRSTCSTSSCAADSITRVQAARMIAEALNLAPVSGSRFTDVARSDAGVVNAVVNAGIATGCSASRFCPNELVSRAQLATMVDRASR